MNIRRIKKAELHCHVDGLLNPAIAKELRPRSEYRALIAQLAKVCPVKSFQDWSEKYGPQIYPLVSDKGELLLEVLKQYLRVLKAQNVIYSEIMLSSFTFQFDDIERQLELYKRYRKSADQIGGEEMQVEFLIAIGRTADRSKMESRLERILAVKEAGLIRGVAVAGLEAENTIKPYSDMFRQFKEAGLGIEIHAGEWKGPEFIWEALEYGFAHRIGHGLSAFQDPVLVGYIKHSGVHIEFCPTSNLLLTNHKNIRDHPIGKAIQEGISFSINTDDPGPFCCDIEQEYSMVQKAFKLSKAELHTVLKNSLDAGFADIQSKQRMIAKLNMD
jgi:adenosine deaminase